MNGSLVIAPFDVITVQFTLVLVLSCLFIILELMGRFKKFGVVASILAPQVGVNLLLLCLKLLGLHQLAGGLVQDGAVRHTQIRGGGRHSGSLLKNVRFKIYKK